MIIGRYNIDVKRFTVAVLILIMLIVGVIVGVVSLFTGSEEVPVSSSSSLVSSVSVVSVSDVPQSISEEKTLAPSVISLQNAVAENPDTVAWLNATGTDINAQVMQSDDNEYYLKHNEKKEESIWGAYFADFYSDLSAPNQLVQNTVIYGHSSVAEDPDGNKFSQLFKYMDIDFVRENPYIYLTVGEEELIFEIFAVFHTHIDFHYINPAPSSTGFAQYLSDIQARNEYIFDGEAVTEQDKLLTLSACSYRYDINQTDNHRYAIVAKLVEQERTDIDVQPNPNPLIPTP